VSTNTVIPNAADHLGTKSRHLKTHSKPFRCTTCGKGFALRLDLSRHVKARHRIGYERYACSVALCKFTATRKDNLHQHEKRVHGHSPQVDPTQNPEPSKNESASDDSNDKSNVQSPPAPASSHQPWSCAIFLQAATAGNLSAMEACLNAGVDINAIADDRSSALHCAARAGHTHIVQFLLEQGAKLENTNRKNRTPFQEALLGRDTETVTFLLRKMAEPGDLHITAICIAQSGSVELLRACIAYSDQNRVGELKNHILHAASRFGQTSIVAALLSDAGNHITQVNNAYASSQKSRDIVDRLDLPWVERIKNKNNFTPMHLAAAHGHLGVVQLLAEQQFNVNVIASNKVPLLLAVQAGHWDVVEYLLSLNSIEVNKRDVWGRTTLHVAAIAGQLEAVESLLRQKSVDVRSLNESRQSPLQSSAFHGHWNVAQALLDTEEGLSVPGMPSWSLESSRVVPSEVVTRLLRHPDFQDVNVRDESASWSGGCGQALLHAAARKNECDVIRLLLSQDGIDVNLPTRGWPRKSPLQLAIERGHTDAAKLLLQHDKIDVNLHSPYSQAPLKLARDKGLDEIVELLLARGAVDHEDDTQPPTDTQDTTAEPNTFTLQGGEPAERNPEVQLHSFLEEYMDDSSAYMLEGIEASNGDGTTWLDTVLGNDGKG